MIYYKKIIYLFVLTISLNIESNTNIEYSIEMIFIEYEDVLIDDERFNEVFNKPDESIKCFDGNPGLVSNLKTLIKSF